MSKATSDRIVYVVDDQPEQRELVKRILMKGGYSPEVFEEPRALLERCETQRPELVVTDVAMPTMTGLELTKTLRAKPWGEELAIIICSGMGHEDDVINGFEAGADDYLIKPIRSVELIAKARVYLNMVSLAQPKSNRLGKFVDLELVTEGGMGKVYKAYQEDVEQTVALKLLKTELIDNREVAQRFLTEGRLLMGLDHPHIVKVFDVGSIDGSFFISMEYLEGEPLGLYADTLDEAETVDILEPLVDAMATYDDVNIVHRDVKPENIVMVEGRGPVLLDFGLARRLGDPHVTTEGMVVGTPLYMSPEQISGARDVDIRADIYGLGHTIYHLLAGTHPFESPIMLEVLVAHMEQTVPPIQDVRPDVSPELAKVVHKMIERDLDRRYATPGRLLRDIRRIRRR